jgi:hypothetical protein
MSISNCEYTTKRWDTQAWLQIELLTWLEYISSIPKS